MYLIQLGLIGAHVVSLTRECIEIRCINVSKFTTIHIRNDICIVSVCWTEQLKYLQFLSCTRAERKEYIIVNKPYYVKEIPLTLKVRDF